MSSHHITVHEEEARFLSRVFNGMSEMIRVTDGKGNILLQNDAYRQWRGNKAPGRCFEDVGQQQPCTECICVRAIEENRRIFKEMTVDGRVFALESCPIQDITGRNAAAMEEIRDITEYREMYRALMDRYRKMETDLAMAKSLQHMLLPKEDSFGEYAWQYIFRPCESLGGDILDVVSLGNGRKAFYIADVSGHGVTAAMMTTLLYETVRSSMLGNPRKISSSDVLSSLRKKFCPPTLGEDNYVTLIMAILDSESGEVDIANAGHAMLPITITASGEASELDIRGMPLSNWPGSRHYENYRLKMEKGSALLLYTDGLVKGGRQGAESILPLVRQSSDGNLFEHLKEYAESIESDDDITLMMLKRD